MKEENCLTDCWRAAHDRAEQSPAIDIEQTLRLKNSPAIGAIVRSYTWQMIVCWIALAVYLGMLAYAYLWLKLSLSVPTNLMLVLTGVYILSRSVIALNRYQIFRFSADLLPVEQSELFFRRRLRRIRTMDFALTLIFSCVMAGFILFHIAGDSPQSVGWSMAAVVLLLGVPWLTRYLFNRRYGTLLG